ncbi:MAG: hypothetical protein HOP06_00490 [Methylotenera sp.]|nr:hypothetical protein [Methylotenera sp.]
MENVDPLPPSFPRRRELSLIEQQWLDVANQRLDGIKNKEVETIPWDIQRKRIDQRLSK